MNIKIFLIFATFSLATSLRTLDVADHLRVLEKVEKVSGECAQDLQKLDNTTLVQVLSSWSTFRLDLEYGNSHDFGDFLACKRIDRTRISTKYCLLQLFSHKNPPLPVQPASSFYQTWWTRLDISSLVAVCVPDSCSESDVEEMIEMELSGSDATLGPDIYCKGRLNEESGRNFERIFVISCLVLISVLFNTFGPEKLRASNILKDLFDTKVKNPSTAYLNGIKALLSIAVILFHSWLYRSSFPFKYGQQIKFSLKNYETPFHIISHIVMELFFIIGGILTSKSLARSLRKGHFLKSLPKFYFKRFMRLFPVAFLCIALVATYDDENQAPFMTNYSRDNCRRYWWKIFTLEFLGESREFATYCWFILVYFHLTLAAPAVYMLIKNKKIGVFSSISVLVASITAEVFFLVDSARKLSKLPQTSNEYGLLLFFEYASIKFRLLPFFGGMVLEEFWTKKISISGKDFIKVFKLFASAAATLWLIGYKEHALAVLFMFSMLSVLFSVNFLHQSDNGMIKGFLSHKFWQPITKLGLSSFLMSSYLIFNFAARIFEPLEVESVGQFTLMVLDDALYGLIPTILCYFFIDEPFRRLGKFLEM